jgi:hypothetical protein
MCRTFTKVAVLDIEDVFEASIGRRPQLAMAIPTQSPDADKPIHPVLPFELGGDIEQNPDLLFIAHFLSLSFNHGNSSS